MEATRRSPARLVRAISYRPRSGARVRLWPVSTVLPRRSYATTAAAPPENIAVIGGGITGLTTAYYLARLLPATSRVTLYEAADEIGGWIHTHKEEAPGGGTVHFEKGPRMLRGLGGSGFRGDDYVFYDMITDLNLAPKISPPRKKLFCYNDQLIHLPPLPTPRSLLRTAWQLARGTHILSGMPAAALRYRRLRMRDLPASGAAAHDVSVGDWLRMTFGDLPGPRNVLSGMLHGIYGGHVDRLGLSSVLPAFWYWMNMRAGAGEELVPRQDYELMKELDPRKRGIEEGVRNWSVAEVMSFPGGMSTFVYAIRDALGRCPNVTLKTGAPVSGIRYVEELDKVELSTPSAPAISYDKVISTTPSATLSPLVPNIPLPTDAVSIMTISLFYAEENLTSHNQAFGYLIPLTTPNPEQVLGVFFDSDTYGLSPSEKRGTKLTVLMGGHFWSGEEGGESAPVPDKEECVRRAKAMLARHLGLTAAPEVTHVNFARGCIPQHSPSHRAVLSHAHDALAAEFRGRLAVAGGSYTPVGVMPAMRAGYDAACQVAGRPRPHVGDTGLAQFKDGLDVITVPREELNALGKRLRGPGAVGRWFSGQ
ncbi:uncharacterized protein DNG_00475 [Cephalotrichum gorgonifer]|uniref:Protoporphyrinogen oxidase n=1 Tax=Cephalotrichum gorgonifer TaxID=2041049 RepID=A0AAE8MP71_9PEZI|nr:uncharacterized protein DNG_00475 [Cephalotrichum gorgonifer]